MSFFEYTISLSNIKERTMNFLTAAILSGVLYDLLKKGTSLTIGALKAALQEWIVEEETLEKICSMEIDRSMSEYAIQGTIEKDSELSAILSRTFKKEERAYISQTHSGTGDNVGRDKIEVEKKG